MTKPVELATDANAAPRPGRALGDHLGRWVAVDRRSQDVVVAADDPLDLAAKIRRRGLTGVSITRVPDRGEPELLGHG